MKQLLLLILFFGASSLSFSQTDTDTLRIDSVMVQCLDSAGNQNTASTVKCVIKAMDQWDAEMNVYYRLLMKKLGNEGRSKLKSAQKKWLEYRNTEMEFSSLVCNPKKEETLALTHANRMCEIVKKRALELREYYNLLNNTGK